jgi:hypothetical protein
MTHASTGTATLTLVVHYERYKRGVYVRLRCNQ